MHHGPSAPRIGRSKGPRRCWARSSAGSRPPRAPGDGVATSCRLRGRQAPAGCRPRSNRPRRRSSIAARRPGWRPGWPAAAPGGGERQPRGQPAVASATRRNSPVVGRVMDQCRPRRRLLAGAIIGPARRGGVRVGRACGDGGPRHRLTGEVEAPSGWCAGRRMSAGERGIFGMRRAGSRRRVDGVGDQIFHRRVLVDDAVDEAGVGAVLEQAAHEIGEQGLVAADRRVARTGGDARPPTIWSLERLAHAVQTLELVVARLPCADRRRRRGGRSPPANVRVVGGELQR